jgi:hypothetical protein
MEIPILQDHCDTLAFDFGFDTVFQIHSIA